MLPRLTYESMCWPAQHTNRCLQWGMHTACNEEMHRDNMQCEAVPCRDVSRMRTVGEQHKN